MYYMFQPFVVILVVALLMLNLPIYEQAKLICVGSWALPPLWHFLNIFYSQYHEIFQAHLLSPSFTLATTYFFEGALVF